MGGGVGLSCYNRRCFIFSRSAGLQIPAAGRGARPFVRIRGFMASRPSRFLKGPVVVTCTIALASALSLPPVALAASDGSSLDAGEARITLQSNGRMLKFDQALINQVGHQHTGAS